MAARRVHSLKHLWMVVGFRHLGNDERRNVHISSLSASNQWAAKLWLVENDGPWPLLAADEIRSSVLPPILRSQA